MGEFIDEFHDEISTKKAPVTIWPLLLLSYTMSKYRMHPGLLGSLSQPIQLSAFETQSAPPTPGSSGITSETDYIN